MARSPADIRYARALFLQAEEKGASVAVNDELRMLRRLIRDSSDLKAFLSHPLLPADKQQQVLTAIFGKRLNDVTSGFLGFLASRRRLRLLSGICEKFEGLFLESRNILRISIVSAFDMSREQVDAIQKAMAKKYGKQIEADVTIDANLLGGFVIQVRDTVHDCSVRGKLNMLQLALCGG